MLKSLFGNLNIERVLFFLFVNEKCYGTQLHTLLKVPLTPIQKALSHLENTQVITSHFEGKSRIYQFNPSYPMRWELEELIKKAYTLLPSIEKKKYCFIHKHKALHPKKFLHKKKELFSFWDRLRTVSHLSLTAKSRKKKEVIIKTGRAQIIVNSPSDSILTFEENGVWFLGENPDTSFHNIFRWTLDSNMSLITLEHLRYGKQRPVFLFYLTPFEYNKLHSVDAHLCGEDTYLGSVVWSPDHIAFHWRIIGPRKNEELIYNYT